MLPQEAVVWRQGRCIPVEGYSSGREALGAEQEFSCVHYWFTVLSIAALDGGAVFLILSMELT